MSVGKGFMGGFGGCLGVGCAVVVVLIAIPVGCLMIGGVAASGRRMRAARPFGQSPPRRIYVNRQWPAEPG